MANTTPEEVRLAEARAGKAPWRLWGPYLSERQWGTVREDYSPCGSAWDDLPHDHARSQAYRWGEDGIAGIADEEQRLCLAVALWNEKDPILKERMFGLANHQGNHGEDVKEYYFYLDNTPTHSYMKILYKYPQAAFPYHALVEVNRQRKSEPNAFEYELLDTGVFADNRYTDVLVEYAKASPTDILLRISLTNRGPDPAPLHLLPTLWFRNTWSWTEGTAKPSLNRVDPAPQGTLAIDARHETLGAMRLYCQEAADLLFVENETNTARLYGATDGPAYPKDGINEYIVSGSQGSVDPAERGTKAAAHYRLHLQPGEIRVVRLRLSTDRALGDPFGGFDAVFDQRSGEADAFYRQVAAPEKMSDEHRTILRQAVAGILWSRQFYCYDVERWLLGDRLSPPPERRAGRNAKWWHLRAHDILSVPDTWEFPYVTSWDLAFHTLVIAMVDLDEAKRQIVLLMRERYMSPEGQVPAYEWGFSDVNPPVQAWAAWRLYQHEKQRTGKGDLAFLRTVFQQALLNFGWWVNREDKDGDSLFQGGFLGLDNIGVFNRDEIEQVTGGRLDQADGTSWMGLFALDMLRIALELGGEHPEDLEMAAKLIHHFLYIADSMNGEGRLSLKKTNLWNDEDGFFYDVLTVTEGHHTDRCGHERPKLRCLPIKAQTLIGLMALFPTLALDQAMLHRDPYGDFRQRLDDLRRARPHLTNGFVSGNGSGDTLLLSFVDESKLRRLLAHMLDESKFLGPYGIRSVPKMYAAHPYSFEYRGRSFGLDYEPAESRTGMFGGNSNWRGPVWFPVNYLLIESLREFHRHYGDAFTVECPTGSGTVMTLDQVADEIARRLIAIFERGADGRRPVYGGTEVFQTDPHWRDLILFHEYFHGDNGAGLGASHQTGWTALVAKLIQKQAAVGRAAPA